MKYLLDSSPRQVVEGLQLHPEVTLGQLLTPLTNYRLASGCAFGVDNGAFTSFDPAAWGRVLNKVRPHMERCLFVVVPDVVAQAPATWRKWREFAPVLLEQGWPLAYVAQDGFARRVPAGTSTLFIGGTDHYKDAPRCLDDVRWALDKGLRVHVGRVNTPARWRMFAAAGAHTCDGSGVSRFLWKLARIAQAAQVVRPQLL